MKKKNWEFEVEEIELGLHNLTGLSNAVYEVIYRGVFTPEAYEGAVFILSQEIQRLYEKAQQIVAGMYT